jgi:hypothetical protein
LEVPPESGRIEISSIGNDVPEKIIRWMPSPSPISAEKWFVFMRIEHRSNCKQLNLMRLFADMP